MTDVNHRQINNLPNVSIQVAFAFLPSWSFAAFVVMEQRLENYLLHFVGCVFLLRRCSWFVWSVNRNNDDDDELMSDNKSISESTERAFEFMLCSFSNWMMKWTIQVMVERKQMFSRVSLFFVSSLDWSPLKISLFNTATNKRLADDSSGVTWWHSFVMNVSKHAVNNIVSCCLLMWMSASVDQREAQTESDATSER